jgi:hypothetical protein
VEFHDLEHAGDLVHVLSHRRMKVSVFRGPLGRRRSFALPSPEYDAIEAVSLRGLLDRPHASLTLKILEVAKLYRRGLPFVGD